MIDEPDLQIANTILYEGYLLYPYRATALKNRQRWHFGVLYPRPFCEREQANDAWLIHSECLASAEVTERAQIQVRVRFLQLIEDNAVEREVLLDEVTFQEIQSAPKTQRFSFPGVDGSIELSATLLTENIWKLIVRTSNDSRFSEGNREEALAHSLISTHAILTVRLAKFISAIDPPAELQTLISECRNIGCWPVLLGKTGQLNKMLTAPIVLYDYPRISPQSQGDHFDCTEIDEMLALRIATLTDEEKLQMSQDERTRVMLERTHGLSNGQLLNLHGQVEKQRSEIFRPGQHVRLRPRGRSDIFDLALDGKTAVVESVECNFENQIYVTVTVDEDPGRDLGRLGRPGHRFFFRPEEVEPL
ncbi:MAG TPA: hypothetical protein VEK08_09125 [Planctomycetota bacterium]|nr:hypothetical protein [Planctomycetota bacterium]